LRVASKIERELRDLLRMVGQVAAALAKLGMPRRLTSGYRSAVRMCFVLRLM
jgi:hypothetical protein